MALDDSLLASGHGDTSPRAPSAIRPAVRAQSPAAVPDILAALRTRYFDTRGGVRRWVCAEHVHLGKGPSDRTRVADLIAVDLWGSRGGMQLHGLKVKVSRTDWLTELRNPSKAEAIRPYLNRWWLVVPDVGIVRDDLPTGWGLIVAPPGQAPRVRTPASANPDPQPLPRPLLGALLRATAQTTQ